MRKEYNKLIRDNILDIISSQNKLYFAETLNENEFITAVKNKLIEEVMEFNNCSSVEEMIEELADIYEVINVLISTLNIPQDKILEKQYQKQQEKGGFTKKIFLKWVEDNT